MDVIAALNRNIRDNRFAEIIVNNFAMSIQAHDGAYCCPREDGLEPCDYLSFEVVVFPISDAEIPSQFRATFEQYRDGPTNVYGYVPAEMVQEMYDMLSRS